MPKFPRFQFWQFWQLWQFHQFNTVTSKIFGLCGAVCRERERATAFRFVLIRVHSWLRRFLSPCPGHYESMGFIATNEMRLRL